jgi:hypothetical protein
VAQDKFDALVSGHYGPNEDIVAVKRQEVPVRALSKLAQVVGMLVITMLTLGFLYWADLLPSLQPSPERTALRR